ncbi:DUF616 domain-containing protein [Mesorhizobium sp. AR07]|uniref:DUF616 domain-containing protein n=1 Tax=Mesorhizobium sp. AR07 TaxID=2865838 RepID=UPI00215DE726|nr:DUF616 domain-containing protein [Mesorhizobium sp. AR07]UVK45688.1 DUF616 domain-containing protein [Mesorhizobium sp. AR07]
MRKLFGKIATWARLQRPRRVVYTCLFGYSEHFVDHHYERDDETDFLCFTDDKSLTSDFWRFRYLASTELGPVRTSKKAKILPHRYLATYSRSLYVDNTVQLVAPVSTLFEMLDASAVPMMCFAHNIRNCIYEEAKEVVALNYDDRPTIESQMSRYRATGHPEKAGLITGSTLFRRHNDPTVKSVMEDWFAEVQAHSYRDQLSFNYVARRRDFQPALLNGNSHDNDIMKWPVVVGPRLPRKFRDDVYLALNPDIKAAGMNPRQHYLLHGASEGRRWE